MTWAAADLTASWRNRRAALGSVAALVLGAFMVISWRQVPCWSSSITLWTHAAECTQDNILAHNGLGNAFLERGRPAEAAVEFREATRIDPTIPEIHNNLGVALAHSGHFDEGARRIPRSDPHRFRLPRRAQ